MVKKNETQKSEITERSNAELRFKGVRKRKWGKYVSEIRLPNSRERIWLGSYDSAEKAARAFDAALFCLRGGAAKFNFPDNPPKIEGGRSLTPVQIQEAAARFANSAPSTSQSEEQSTSGFQTESPSPSISTTETVELDSWRDLELDGPFLDLLGMGSGNFGSDYGMFPGFGDLSNDLLGASTPMFDFGEENFDSATTEGSFLWNF